jgi:pSer/pThr/pTyr-binding forkhead associated (FHA) protein
MSWKIKAIAGPFVGQEILIDDNKIIGRDTSVDVVLQGGHISRRHAELSVRDDQLWIKDLNSSNGTYVNGERITEVQLKHHDQLQFDVVQFLVISSLIEQAHIAQSAATTNISESSQTKNTLPAVIAVVILILMLIASAWYYMV